MTQEFKEAFPQGHNLTINDISTVMKCKNIDFGHVNWHRYMPDFFSKVVMYDTNLLTHLTHNIIDVHVNGDNKRSYYSFIGGVYVFCDTTAFEYVINNRYINNEFFDKMNSGTRIIYDNRYKKLKELMYYLTDVSLNKFPGFYNIEKYYDMIYIMLLVTRVQTILPKSIVKHLIIPFVYQ